MCLAVGHLLLSDVLFVVFLSSGFQWCGFRTLFNKFVTPLFNYHRVSPGLTMALPPPNWLPTRDRVLLWPRLTIVSVDFIGINYRSRRDRDRMVRRWAQERGVCNRLFKLQCGVFFLLGGWFSVRTHYRIEITWCF